MRVILKYFAIALSCLSIFPISAEENITFISLGHRATIGSVSVNCWGKLPKI